MNFRSWRRSNRFNSQLPGEPEQIQSSGLAPVSRNVQSRSRRIRARGREAWWKSCSFSDDGSPSPGSGRRALHQLGSTTAVAAPSGECATAIRVVARSCHVRCPEWARRGYKPPTRLEQGTLNNGDEMNNGTTEAVTG